MSSTIAQPTTGHTIHGGPILAAVLAATVALAAIGLAASGGFKTTPVAGAVPGDVQAALISHRASERQSLVSGSAGNSDANIVDGRTEYMNDKRAEYLNDARLLVLQAELADRAAAAGPAEPTAPIRRGGVVQR